MEIYLIGGLALVAVAEAAVIVRVSVALQALSRFGDRLAHLAAALELLTDTTEIGLANVASELERTTPQRSARSSRGATTRRISQAVRHGQSIDDIAAAEALSHGEVRLHLELATAATELGGGHGAMRG